MDSQISMNNTHKRHLVEETEVENEQQQTVLPMNTQVQAQEVTRSEQVPLLARSAAFLYKG